MPSFEKNGEQKQSSPEFQEVIKQFGHTRLLEGASFDGSMEEWAEQRRFIAQAIDRDGTLLDIGSANGFLLRCLQEWTGKDLEPFGLDKNERRLDEAKVLFPGDHQNFVLSEDEESMSAYPEQFDLVYWNVWDNVDFEDPDILKILVKGLELTQDGGRLILGFYNEDTEESSERLLELKDFGLKFEGIQNPNGPERLVIIEKVPENLTKAIKGSL